MQKSDNLLIDMQNIVVLYLILMLHRSIWLHSLLYHSIEDIIYAESTLNLAEILLSFIYRSLTMFDCNA